MTPKLDNDKLVIYRYDDESETSMLMRDNNIQQRGHGARGSLMGSADYRRHLGNAQSSANQDESGSVNGDNGHVKVRAPNESEAICGARDGDEAC